MISIRNLACGFIFLLTGYSGMRYFYNSSDYAQDSPEMLSHFAFVVLVICSFLTGAGGNGGLTASVNASAKSFPDEMVSVLNPEYPNSEFITYLFV